MGRARRRGRPTSRSTGDDAALAAAVRGRTAAPLVRFRPDADVRPRPRASGSTPPGRRPERPHRRLPRGSPSTGATTCSRVQHGRASATAPDRLRPVDAGAEVAVSGRRRAVVTTGRATDGRGRQRPVPPRPRRRAPRASRATAGPRSRCTRSARGERRRRCGARLAHGRAPPAPRDHASAAAAAVEVRAAAARSPLEVDGVPGARRRTITVDVVPDAYRAPALSGSSEPANVRVGRRSRRYHRQPPVPSEASVLYAPEHVHRRRSGHPPAVLHEPRRAGLRAHQPARGREGRAVRAVLALRQEPAPPLPRRVRRRSRPHRRPHRRRDRRPAARRGALRPRVPRIRRRLRRAARRRAPRVRAGVEPAHEDPRVGPPDGVPRAVDALHPVRLTPATAATATTATVARCCESRARHARYIADMDALFDTYSAMLPRDDGLGARALPEGSARLRLRLQADDQGEGVRHGARRPARGDALERRHLRHRPGVTRRCCCACARTRCPRRSAYAATDARRAAQGDPVVPRPRRPARPRRSRGARTSPRPATPPPELVAAHLRGRASPSPRPDGHPHSTSTPTAKTRCSPRSATRTRTSPKTSCSTRVRTLARRRPRRAAARVRR